MSAAQQAEGAPQGREEQQPQRPLQRIMEALGLNPSMLKEPEPKGTGGGKEAPQIIAPVNVDRLIEMVLEAPPAEETEDTSKIVGQVSKVVFSVHVLARKLIDMYLRDGITRIQHPVYSVPGVESRFGMLTQVLANTVKEIWDDVAYHAVKRDMPATDFSEYVKEAEVATRFAFAILVTVYDALMQLFYINAPPPLRPPLANASLGYELLMELHSREKE